MDIISCFITGNRTERFRFKHVENCELCRQIKQSLRMEILRHITEENVQRFYSGGALGADIWGAEIVLDLKEKAKYKGLELVLMRPFPTHGEKYDDEQRERYERVLRLATDSIVTYARALPSAYKRRNYCMVDLCQYGIAVYDNDKAMQTGTGQTIAYAVSRHKKITLIHPDTGAVSLLEEDKLPALYSVR